MHLEFTYSDHEAASPRTAGLKLRRYARPSERGSANDLSGPPWLPLTSRAPQPGDKPPYRRLLVEVRAAGVTARLDDDVVQELPAERFAYWRRFLFDFKPLPTELPEYPQGTLGLMVWNGTASFRNVVVEPLDEDK
jgi:hypothetical protein